MPMTFRKCDCQGDSAGYQKKHYGDMRPHTVGNKYDTCCGCGNKKLNNSKTVTVPTKSKK